MCLRLVRRTEKDNRGDGVRQAWCFSQGATMTDERNACLCGREVGMFHLMFGGLRMIPQLTKLLSFESRSESYG